MRFSLILLLCLVSCSEDFRTKPSKASTKENFVKTSPKPLPKGRVILQSEGQPEKVVHVEIAATEESRQRGLMFREKLGENEGMLFLFAKEEQLSFWMENTYLPLDIIFIKSDMTVLGVVEGATPLTKDSRMVEGESQFVLEVNATYAKRHGITAGTRVRFEGTGQLIPEPKAP